MRKVLFLFALIAPIFQPGPKAQNAPSSGEIPACNTPERKVAIRKDGERRIYVYSKNGWSFNGFMLEFSDQAGNFIAADTINHVPPPPQVMGLDDPTLFVTLRPDDFFGQRGHALLKGFIKSPGKYTLRVSYTSPALCALFDPKIQALPALWHHDPDIVSNTVSFE